MQNIKKDLKTYIYLVFLVIADQLTNYLFFNQKIFEWLFTPVLNNGISRSMPVNMTLIYLISFGAIGFIFQMRQKQKIWKYEFILFTAWLLGNLIDRLFLGWVRDFIDLRFFPIFNLADVFLTISVAIMFYHEIFGKWKKSEW